VWESKLGTKSISPMLRRRCDPHKIPTGTNGTNHKANSLPLLNGLRFLTERNCTPCSDSSIISVHGRQAPKEHRCEGLTCFRSGPSLRLSSGASGLPSTVNYQVVRNLRQPKSLPSTARNHIYDYRDLAATVARPAAMTITLLTDRRIN
jgi:hypothetical protein